MSINDFNAFLKFGHNVFIGKEQAFLQNQCTKDFKKTFIFNFRLFNGKSQGCIFIISFSHTLLNLRPEKKTCKSINQNFTKNEQRYLHHLNSNFDSAICCSGLLHRCQWNRCLIGHGRQRNGNNEGGKTTSDSQ